MKIEADSVSFAIVSSTVVKLTTGSAVFVAALCELFVIADAVFVIDDVIFSVPLDNWLTIDITADAWSDSRLYQSTPVRPTQSQHAIELVKDAPLTCG